MDDMKGKSLLRWLFLKHSQLVWEAALMTAGKPHGYTLLKKAVENKQILLTVNPNHLWRYFVMNSQILYRWSGVVLLVGGLLCLVSSTLSAFIIPGTNPTPGQILSAPWFLFEILLYAGLLLLVLGLPGGYLRQSGRAGMLGFAGFLLLLLGILFTWAFASARVVIWPYFAQSAPSLLPSGNQGPALGFILWIMIPIVFLILGEILLGISILRTGVFPRPVGWLFIAAGVLNILTFFLPPSDIAEIMDPITDAVFFIAFTWMGYILTSRAGSQTGPQTASPSPAQP